MYTRPNLTGVIKQSSSFNKTEVVEVQIQLIQAIKALRERTNQIKKTTITTVAHTVMHNSVFSRKVVATFNDLNE